MENINEIIEIGVINTLKIDRKAEHGFYLIAQDDSAVLLPNQYILESMKIGDIVDVFIYTDSEDRDIATTLTPKSKVGEFALLQVVDVASFGAFMDWGLIKDLFVPKNRQKTPFKVGEKRVIYTTLDEDTNRVIGVEKISKFLSKEPISRKKGDRVDIFILDRTPLGFKVIIENSYEGLIFHNEIFENINRGDKKIAYIKNIRDDGKIDVTLQPTKSHSNFFENKILDALESSSNKMLPFNYKSSPEDITRVFGLSKKNFKKSLTSLKEANKIEISEYGIKQI